MKNLKIARQNKGLTQNKLADKIGVSRSTIAMYETDASDPDYETAKAIAKVLNCSVDYLYGIDSNVTTADLGSSHIKIPVYGEIPAGIPIEMIDQSYIEDYEDINADLLRDGSQYFCLKVKGQSMMPKFEDGDVLILRQQPDCNNGDFCAVSINCTECTFKKVIKHSNGITLQPLNPAFEPMFFSNQEVIEKPITILGVVKEIRRGL